MSNKLPNELSTKHRSPGRRSQEEAARTRARLLDTGERLFAQKGYRALSLRELADACDVSPFTIQHHFGSKQGLYEQILGRWDSTVLDLVQTTLAAESGATRAVEKIVDDLFEFLLSKRDWVRITSRAALGDGAPDDMDSGHTNWVDIMDESIRERRLGGARFDLGLLLITIEGLLNHHVLSSAHYRRLYGKDVTDARLKSRTKAHLERVILALLRES